MRMEWISVVRRRDWKVFEQLAREEPSWMLYETVRELATGMPDRESRYRLGLILDTLKASGYSESKTSATPPGRYVLPVHPFRIAVITEPDPIGEQTLHIAYPKGEQIVTVAVSTYPEDSDYEPVYFLNKFHHRPLNRGRALRGGAPLHFKYQVEAPFEYVAGRILSLIADKAVDSRFKPFPGHVFKDLEKFANSESHPTDPWQIDSIPGSQVEGAYRSHPLTKDWLIYVSERLPCMPEIMGVTLDLRMSVDKRAERRYELLMQDYPLFVTETVVRQFGTRFKDAGYVLSRENRWEDAAMMIGIGRRIQEDGVDSPFFPAIIRHTAKVLPAYLSDNLKRSHTKLAA